MARGVFDPKNAAPDTGGGGFKEGLIRVDKSCYKVYQAAAPTSATATFTQRSPVVALCWGITRLNEETQEPMEDKDSNPLTENLVFSLGGKSLLTVQPGSADSPNSDDESIEGLGVEVNTEGPTLHFTGDFKLHPKSGAAHLMNSLLKAGFKKDLILREWAPDFVGLVCFMKTFLSDDPKDVMLGSDGKSRPVPYKIVDRLIRAPYEKKEGKAAAAAVGSANGRDKASEAILEPILQALSSDLDSETITFAVLAKRVSTALQKGKIDIKSHVPVLALVKDDKWLKKNGPDYDMTIDFEDKTVLFGKAVD